MPSYKVRTQQAFCWMNEMESISEHRVQDEMDWRCDEKVEV